MTKYEKAAKKALSRELSARKDPLPLFDVSCIADEAARNAGKKRDLFGSLWDYPDLLPGGWSTRWLSTSDSPTADSMAYAVPPNWTSGSTNSQSLVLGGGKLQESKSHFD
jgi:hypothetical protein